jgi:hypothetical protein
VLVEQDRIAVRVDHDEARGTGRRRIRLLDEGQVRVLEAVLDFADVRGWVDRLGVWSSPD